MTGLHKQYASGYGKASRLSSTNVFVGVDLFDPNHAIG